MEKFSSRVASWQRTSLENKPNPFSWFWSTLEGISIFFPKVKSKCSRNAFAQSSVKNGSGLEVGTWHPCLSQQRQDLEDKKLNKLLPVSSCAIQNVIKCRGMRFREGMNGAGLWRNRSALWLLSLHGTARKPTLLPDIFLNCYFGKFLWLLQFRIKNI